MSCCLCGTKPLPETTMTSCQLDHWEQTAVKHYSDVIICATASQITSLTSVYSTIYSGSDQRKHQTSASLAFVRGIHRWPVNSPHKWLVTRKVFPFDDVIMFRANDNCFQSQNSISNCRLRLLCLDVLNTRKYRSKRVISTVYPKKYAHGFCFAVLCCGYTLTDFPISIRLTSLALWQSNDCPSASKATLMNMDKYFMWIRYERLHNHNKQSTTKPCACFLGYTVAHTFCYADRLPPVGLMIM